MNEGKVVTFLIVDDDKIDRKILRRAMANEKIANPIVEAIDGQDAIEKLRGTSVESNISGSCIVLLDLNMPRMNGIEFLAELRNDPNLKHTIVFVMTTSNSDEDKIEVYNFNVAGYILKGQADGGIAKTICMLDAYWKIVEFPPGK